MDNHSKRVLVVDDALVTRLSVAEGLQGLETSILVEPAESIDVALHKVQRDGTILILAEVSLLGEDRDAAVAALREQAPEAQIFLTGDFFDAHLAEVAARLGVDGCVHKPFTLEHMREIVERAAEPAEERDAPASRRFRPAPALRQLPKDPDPRTALPSVTGVLERLLESAGARVVLLLTMEGHSVAAKGQLRGLHIPTLGALTAANFAAAAELSRQLGNETEFRASHHTGPNCSIYTYEAADNLLLAVVFDTQSVPGAVWLFARRAAAELANVLPLPSTALPTSGLAEAVDQGFDDLFAADGP